jgi:hypothetical protein
MYAHTPPSGPTAYGQPPPPGQDTYSQPSFSGPTANEDPAYTAPTQSGYVDAGPDLPVVPYAEDTNNMVRLSGALATDPQVIVDNGR